MNYTGRNTIYDYIRSEDIPDGIHTMELSNGTIIDFEIINYLEDKTFSTDEFLGDDIPDTKMLILKFHKNCVIEKDVVLTPQVRKKGFTIYVKESLINDGTISMTQRGANAEGQDVLIYGNEGDGFHKIPAIGASGGIRLGGVAGTFDGNNGDNAVDRGTGGGGSGGFRGNYNNYWSGAGTAGTSYSGGTGGGGNAFNDGPGNAQDGQPNGGAGGLSYCRRTSANGWNATGGVGNPAGKDSYSSGGANVGAHTTTTSESGTGGLLIIYSKILSNTGSIQANGSDSKLMMNIPTHCATGGSSGGGSVNIYSEVYADMSGTVTATGGRTTDGDTTATRGIAKGGDGGDGSVNINIATNIFDIKKLVESDKLSFILTKISRTIREELVSLGNNINTDLNSLEEQINSLASATYWEDTVDTTSNLPSINLKIGETHYVEDISSYARWNGTKWIFIAANIITKVTEELDGILSHEDYTLFKNTATNGTLSGDKTGIYEEFDIKQLYNLVNNLRVNFYPKTTTDAVIDKSGRTLTNIIEAIEGATGVSSYEVTIPDVDLKEIIEENEYKGFYKTTITHSLGCAESFRLKVLNEQNEDFTMACSFTNIELDSFDLYTITKQPIKVIVVKGY